MIVDSLTFLGDSIYGRQATAHELLTRMDEIGVDRAIVCPVKPRGYDLGLGNSAVAAAVQTAPDRLLGFGRVDPLLGDDAVTELQRALTDLGLRGLFLNPWEETYPVGIPAVTSILAVAREHSVPVIVACGYPWLSEALQVGDLARRFPDVTIVMTNGGQLPGLGQHDVVHALTQNQNLHMQTMGNYREDFLEAIAQDIGVNRLLFASSFPILDPRLEIRRVQWCHLSEGDKRAILGHNAARILLGESPA